MTVVEKWHGVMKSNDAAKLDDLLADDVVFYSPVVFTPQRGKELTKMYLIAAGSVFGEKQTRGSSSGDKNDVSTFRYIKNIVGDKSALLEFESEIDGIYINGVDLITWNEEGKITEFKVIVRPLQAVNLLHKKMQAMLELIK